MAHAGYGQFPSLPTVDAGDFSGVCARLDTIMGGATPAQVVDGMNWYALRDAHIRRLASRSGLDVEIIALATAALSAQTRWDKNERAIEAHIDAYMAGHTACPATQGWGTLYHVNDAKAWAILHAATPWDGFLLLGKGLKTQAFAPAMLLRPFWLRGVVQEAVIDSIAYQAATGRVPQAIKPWEYKALVRAYQWLARKYNCTTDQAQAIIWVVWRGSAV